MSPSLCRTAMQLHEDSSAKGSMMRNSAAVEDVSSGPSGPGTRSSEENWSQVGFPMSQDEPITCAVKRGPSKRSHPQHYTACLLPPTHVSIYQYSSRTTTAYRRRNFMPHDGGVQHATTVASRAGYRNSCDDAIGFKGHGKTSYPSSFSCS